MAGWVHIKFKKPVIMNGFSITAGWNNDKFPKDFRFYGKVIRHKGDLSPLGNEFGPVAGFDLLKTVKNAEFHYCQFQQKYKFGNEAKHLLVSEIKLMIDTCKGGAKESPELFGIAALF